MFNNRRDRKKVTKCLLGTILYVFIILVLLFIVCFVVIPIVLKYSIGIQRTIVLPTWLVDDKNYTEQIDKLNLLGVKNFYVDVNTQNETVIKLGVWEMLPNSVVDVVIDNKYYNYDALLADNTYKVVLYLHGNGNDRANAIELYQILRDYFLVIACDYRGYGDSSKGNLTETNMVNDVTSLYLWIHNRTESEIYIWGHSLGTAIGTHVVSNLKALNITPSGLILEAPFTSVIDVMDEHSIIKLFSWLPWYRTTITDPFVYNDLNFGNKKYIADVNCPIMILHAQDDDIIPYQHADELYHEAITNRNTSTQGPVKYELFGLEGYGHMWLFEAPELPSHIRNFIEICDTFWHK